MGLDFSSWPLGCVSNSASRWFGFQWRQSNNVDVAKHCGWQSLPLSFIPSPIMLSLPCHVHIFLLFVSHLSSCLSCYFLSTPPVFPYPSVYLSFFWQGWFHCYHFFSLFWPSFIVCTFLHVHIGNSFRQVYCLRIVHPPIHVYCRSQAHHTVMGNLAQTFTRTQGWMD